MDDELDSLWSRVTTTSNKNKKAAKPSKNTAAPHQRTDSYAATLSVASLFGNAENNKPPDNNRALTMKLNGDGSTSAHSAAARRKAVALLQSNSSNNSEDEQWPVTKHTAFSSKTLQPNSGLLTSSNKRTKMKIQTSIQRSTDSPKPSPPASPAVTSNNRLAIGEAKALTLTPPASAPAARVHAGDLGAGLNVRPKTAAAVSLTASVDASGGLQQPAAALTGRTSADTSPVKTQPKLISSSLPTTAAAPATTAAPAPAVIVSPPTMPTTATVTAPSAVAQQQQAPAAAADNKWDEVDDNDLLVEQPRPITAPQPTTFSLTTTAATNNNTLQPLSATQRRRRNLNSTTADSNTLSTILQAGPTATKSSDTLTLERPATAASTISTTQPADSVQQPSDAAPSAVSQPISALQTTASAQPTIETACGWLALDASDAFDRQLAAHALKYKLPSEWQYNATTNQFYHTPSQTTTAQHPFRKALLNKVNEKKLALKYNLNDTVGDDASEYVLNSEEQEPIDQLKPTVQPTEMISPPGSASAHPVNAYTVTSSQPANHSAAALPVATTASLTTSQPTVIASPLTSFVPSQSTASATEQQLQQLVSSLEARVIELQKTQSASIESAINDVHTRHRTELQHLQQLHHSSTELVTAQHQRQIELLKQSHDQQLAALRQQVVDASVMRSLVNEVGHSTVTLNTLQQQVANGLKQSSQNITEQQQLRQAVLDEKQRRVDELEQICTIERQKMQRMQESLDRERSEVLAEKHRLQHQETELQTQQRTLQQHIIDSRKVYEMELQALKRERTDWQHQRQDEQKQLDAQEKQVQQLIAEHRAQMHAFEAERSKVVRELEEDRATLSQEIHLIGERRKRLEAAEAHSAQFQAEQQRCEVHLQRRSGELAQLAAHLSRESQRLSAQQQRVKRDRQKALTARSETEDMLMQNQQVYQQLQDEHERLQGQRSRMTAETTHLAAERDSMIREIRYTQTVKSYVDRDGGRLGETTPRTMQGMSNLHATMPPTHPLGASMSLSTVRATLTALSAAATVRIEEMNLVKMQNGTMRQQSSVQSYSPAADFTSALTRPVSLSTERFHLPDTVRRHESLDTSMVARHRNVQVPRLHLISDVDTDTAGSEAHESDNSPTATESNQVSVDDEGTESTSLTRVSTLPSNTPGSSNQAYLYSDQQPSSYPRVHLQAPSHSSEPAGSEYVDEHVDILTVSAEPSLLSPSQNTSYEPSQWKHSSHHMADDTSFASFEDLSQVSACVAG